MSDLKLFRINSSGVAAQLPGSSVALEKSLQHVIEVNMLTMFGVRFLASEYSTGAKHAGRIDSLGLDETGSPVIFEYKRSINENVMNQGLFYLDWLLDHKAEFELLVMNKLGSAASADIDWATPRVVCIASSFTKYDEHAVLQISRNIELVRYRDFQGELLSFELVTSAKPVSSTTGTSATPTEKKSTGQESSVIDLLEKASASLKDLYQELHSFIEALGDDVTATARKNYFAYRRLKNFACVEVHPQKGNLLVFLKIDPDSVELIHGFMRDVRKIGHFGTGDLELRITTAADLKQALPLVEQSYTDS